MIVLKIKVASKLDDYLKSRGIMKKWLAEQIECDVSQISKWCKNDKNGIATSTPSVGYLLRMKKVLDCELNEIFEEIHTESDK